MNMISVKRSRCGTGTVPTSCPRTRRGNQPGRCPKSPRKDVKGAAGTRGEEFWVAGGMPGPPARVAALWGTSLILTFFRHAHPRRRKESDCDPINPRLSTHGAPLPDARRRLQSFIDAISAAFHPRATGTASLPSIVDPWEIPSSAKRPADMTRTTQLTSDPDCYNHRCDPNCPPLRHRGPPDFPQGGARPNHSPSGRAPAAGTHEAPSHDG